MNQHKLLKNLVLTAAAALGLTAFARADVPLDKEPLQSTTAVGQGLLGQQYANLTYTYIDLDGTSTHADDYTFALNQPLNTGLDAILGGHTHNAVPHASGAVSGYGRPYVHWHRS